MPVSLFPTLSRCHLLNPLDETTSHSTKLQATAAKSLVIPQVGESEARGAEPGGREKQLLIPAGEGAIESLREFHIIAIAELAESLAWYAKRNPTRFGRLG
jgi:hypothetical protein